MHAPLFIAAVNQEKDVEDLSSQLSSLRQSERSRKERIANLTREIEKLKDFIERPPETESLTAIDADLVRAVSVTLTVNSN